MTPMPPTMIDLFSCCLVVGVEQAKAKAKAKAKVAGDDDWPHNFY